MKLSDQKIKRGQYPEKERLIELYKDHTLLEIAELFGTTTTRVRSWFSYYNIDRKSPGGGNNRKVIDQISSEQLNNYVMNGLTNEEISKVIGCSKSNVAKLLRRYSINRSYNTDEYYKYSRTVRCLTEKNYVKYFDVLNPQKHPRTLCGVDGGYQLDHIISVRECFDTHKTAEECSSKENLQIITWEENLQKRKFKRKGENNG